MSKYVDLDFIMLNARNRGVGLRLCKKHIQRYFFWLNHFAPGKYKLDTINMLASIENRETNLTEVTFSENPFRSGIL